PACGTAPSLRAHLRREKLAPMESGRARSDRGLSGGGRADAEPAPAHLDRLEGARRGAQSAWPEPELPARLGRPHQQLPVPALDRPRAVGAVALPERE